jgi:hypothetical protein
VPPTQSTQQQKRVELREERIKLFAIGHPVKPGEHGGRAAAD